MDMNLGGKIPEVASRNKEMMVSTSAKGKAVAAQGVAADGQEDEDEIIESDVEFEGDIVEPDNDPPQKMGDPFRKINVVMRIAAQIAKGQAMTAMSEGNLPGAANSLTMAIVAYPISAIMYATRASVYVQMKKPNAAIRDADAALEINPNHAKGYKYRGMAKAMLGQWEDAAKDLHLASNLDHDEEIYSVLKKVELNVSKIQDHHKKYERLYKEREERKIKRERQQLRAEAQDVLENDKEKLWLIRYPEGMSIDIGWDSIKGGIPEVDFTQESVIEENVSTSAKGEVKVAQGIAVDGQEDQDEIVESDVELEGDIIEPDVDPPQKMGDPSRKINVDMRIAAQIAKGQAMMALSEGNLAGAANSLTMAIVAYPISANMYATRASVYIKMKKPNAAIRDADAALKINPDHAKGYKYRGMARAMLGQWEDAAKDLHLASNLDYDEEISYVLKKVEPNARKIRDHRRKYERLYKERENRKIKRERQQLRSQAQAALENAKDKLWQIRHPEGMSIGIGWDSIGGEIPDIDFTNIIGDPILAAELQEPGILAAIQNVIRKPTNLAKYDDYPKVAQVIVKLFGGN